MVEKYIAHRDELSGEEQLLIDHLRGTAERARDHAAVFGAGGLAYACGSGHDLGKYSAAFQARIRGKDIAVDHSTAGGQYFYEQNNSKALAFLASSCVMGHHGGLPDSGSSTDNPDQATLHGRLKRKVEDYSAYQGEVTIPRLAPPENPLFSQPDIDGFSLAFLTRMLFSSLVDADYLDTEAFYQKHNPPQRGALSEISALETALQHFIAPYLQPQRRSSLNEMRNQLLAACLDAAENPSGIFTLTAPTGSGKTISSLAFALAHAVKWGKRRIIYVIPYNTIIEQNAAVFEEIVGQENVLQHHSNIEYDVESEETSRKRYATENWDYPIIVTSNVQFFESLFASRPGRCRKLHNIANSVIIFDEAQMIPAPYLTPCIRAIRELVERYGCTAVMTTATQAITPSQFAPLEPLEIVQDPTTLATQFQRVTIELVPDDLTDEDLTDALLDAHQVLCIVNTRKQAQDLYKLAQTHSDEGIFHLSTTMYPVHRSKVLKLIRKRLNAGLFCRVISTSLIEAGVDIDFPLVYREKTGLDSIIQAAGRCNREGKHSADESIVRVFTFDAATHKSPRMLAGNIAAFEQAQREEPDLNSLAAITSYFQHLFYNSGEKALDAKGIIDSLERGKKSFAFPFRKVNDEFKLIEDTSKAVIVPGEVPELIQRLRFGERSKELFRRLGKHSVSLYSHELGSLMEIGAIERLDEEVFILTQLYYDAGYGVDLSASGGLGLII